MTTAARAEIKAKLRREYYLANKDRNISASKAWAAANPEKRKQVVAKSYRVNKEKSAMARKTWRENNREQHCIIQHNYRARKKAGGVLSKDIAERLLIKQRGKCACCKVSLQKAGYHMDHIEPLAGGGPNIDTNIQLLCPTCNHTKHARDPIEFMQEKGYLL